MTRDEVPAYREIQRYLVAGVIIVILVTGGIGGWAATAELSSAIIAQGRLVVETNVKKVQHPTGGVVGELLVREGDHVRAGEVVLRLDGTQTRANLAVVTKELDELAARKSREEAEQDDAGTIAFPIDLLTREGDAALEHVINGERKLFDTRRSGREGQRSQLLERIEQHKEEISGLDAQLSAKSKEIEWVQRELEGVNELWSRKLVQFTRVTTLERDFARIEGERGNLIASIAQAKGKIAEIQLQILQIDRDMRTEVGKDLAEVRGKMSELVEKRVAAQDQLKHIDLRAPQDGTVHQLDAHTVGGVVTPGQPIMLIVPDADALTVEAKVPPQDIDQLRVGQAVILRFSAFNQRTTPEINGEVKLVSPDVTQDQKSGAYYYTLHIAASDAEIARLKNLKLVPGMPVEAFVQAKSRTVLSYLIRPFYDQIARTFIEK